MSHYDDNHQITRAGALQVVSTGGSVLLKNKAGQASLISRVEDVPDESWFTTNNRITRADAEAAIKSSGSFHYRGRRYVSVDDLPPAKEFDATNKAATALTRDEILKRREELDAQLQTLDAPPPKPTPTDPNKPATHTAAPDPKPDAKK